MEMKAMRHTIKFAIDLRAGDSKPVSGPAKPEPPANDGSKSLLSFEQNQYGVIGEDGAGTPASMPGSPGLAGSPPPGTPGSFQMAPGSPQFAQPYPGAQGPQTPGAPVYLQPGMQMPNPSGVQAIPYPNNGYGANPVFAGGMVPPNSIPGNNAQPTKK